MSIFRFLYHRLSIVHLLCCLGLLQPQWMWPLVLALCALCCHAYGCRHYALSPVGWLRKGSVNIEHTSQLLFSLQPSTLLHLCSEEAAGELPSLCSTRALFSALILTADPLWCFPKEDRHGYWFLLSARGSRPSIVDLQMLIHGCKVRIRRLSAVASVHIYNLVEEHSG